MVTPGDLLVGQRRQAPGLEAAGVVVVGRVRHERHDEPDRAREREGEEEVAGAEAVRGPRRGRRATRRGRRPRGTSRARSAAASSARARCRTSAGGATARRPRPRAAARRPAASARARPRSGRGRRRARAGPRRPSARAPTRRGRRSGARAPSASGTSSESSGVTEVARSSSIATRRARSACARRVAADRERVRDGGQRDGDDGFRMRIPRERIRSHTATLAWSSRGRSSVGRAPAFQAGCRRFEPGRPLSLAWLD